MMQAVSHFSLPPSMDIADGPIFVTMGIDNQMFGIEVKYVRDVLRAHRVTPIPLSPPEVAGSLNLRGRIVTVIDLRKRLKLAARAEGTEISFVVVEFNGELYSLMVDSVGDVLTSSQANIENVPANLPAHWKGIAASIYKTDSELLVLVDVQNLLSI